MIKINYCQDGNSRRVEIRGHADYAEQGKDIVCAAASILVYSLAEGLKAYGKVHAELSDGHAIIELPADECLDALGAEHAYRAFRVGVKLLAELYPKNILLVGSF